MKPACKEPCPACPFRRDALNGWLGDSTPELFVATTLSGEQMPCHTTANYNRKDWRTTPGLARCAGSLAFLRNQKKRGAAPEVFNSAVEFVAHHEAPVPPPDMSEKIPESGKCFNCDVALTSDSYCFGCKKFSCEECDVSAGSLERGHRAEDHLRSPFDEEEW